MANETDNKWIGKRTIRPDGEDKVTGRANFGADFAQPGMLWGKILRSPHPHARIKSINLERAAATDGVKAVMSGADLVHFPVDVPAPAGPQDLRYVSRNVMARDKALYAGHAVAAVAATSARAAEAALDLIDVEYELLPWVIDVEDAMQDDAPLLHDFMYTQGVDPKPSKPSNIASRSGLTLGDVATGFKEADVIIEQKFKTKPVHQGYIEPHACLVDASPSGQATIWSSSQGQFMVRNVTAKMTGAKLSDIRAIPAEIGGGFGGKTIIYLEPLAYTLSRKAGAPVKMVMTRDEVFRATGPTAGSSNTVKIGARRDGRLTAAQATFRFQAGAFPKLADTRGVELRLLGVRHRQRQGGGLRRRRQSTEVQRLSRAGFAYRGVWRRIRHRRTGRRTRYRPHRVSAHECGPGRHAGGIRTDLPPHRLRGNATRCAGRIRTTRRRKAGSQGRGVACGGWMNAGGESSAQINVNEDGTVAITTGHPDIGGSRASMVNIVAEILGIHYRNISAQVGDTNTIGYSASTGGSRVTFAAGAAVSGSRRNAWWSNCGERAAMLWDIDVDAVDWKDGHAHPAGSNAGEFEPLSLAELASKAALTGGPIAVQTSVNAQGPGARLRDPHLRRGSR